jgi:hypothetical protein
MAFEDKLISAEQEHDIIYMYNSSHAFYHESMRRENT